MYFCLRLHFGSGTLLIELVNQSRFDPESFRPGSFRPISGVGRFGLGRWIVSASFLGVGCSALSRFTVVSDDL